VICGRAARINRVLIRRRKCGEIAEGEAAPEQVFFKALSPGIESAGIPGQASL
jgi:hypothetical protein